ncbi:MAG: nucleotidyltransferase family protein [Chloroflexi bacterium]|nr:nucleotidyltransferase family protein [Chloroflexota bacterium]
MAKPGTPTVDEVREKILRVLRRHGVRRAGLFGSLIQQRMHAESDIDLLVDLPPEKSLLDLAALEIDLREALGREVDVLTYRSLHSAIRERVLDEQVVIL